MIPLFCQGKDIQSTTSEAVGIGAREIPTADADIYFRAGLRVFISQPDGSDVEYLGTIQAVEADSITVELATEGAKSEDANLWVPGALLEWPVGKEAEAARALHSGVEVVRSIGGDAYATKLGTAHTIEAVKMNDMTAQRFQGFLDWFEQVADGGMSEFTYVDAARRVRKVRFEAPTLEWKLTGRDLVSLNFGLHFLWDSSYI